MYFLSVSSITIIRKISFGLRGAWNSRYTSPRFASPSRHDINVLIGHFSAEITILFNLKPSEWKYRSPSVAIRRYLVFFVGLALSPCPFTRFTRSPWMRKSTKTGITRVRGIDPTEERTTT